MLEIQQTLLVYCRCPSVDFDDRSREIQDTAAAMLELGEPMAGAARAFRNPSHLTESWKKWFLENCAKLRIEVRPTPTLTSDLDVQSQKSYGYNPYTRKKIKVKGHSVKKFEWKDTERRPEAIAL